GLHGFDTHSLPALLQISRVVVSAQRAMLGGQKVAVSLSTGTSGAISGVVSTSSVVSESIVVSIGPRSGSGLFVEPSAHPTAMRHNPMSKQIWRMFKTGSLP